MRTKKKYSLIAEQFNTATAFIPIAITKENITTRGINNVLKNGK
jgi:hypothetical protein